MKLVTKAKRFIERMDSVENMTERQLVEMLFRAEKIIAEYVEQEDKKEIAFLRLKEETKYRAIKKDAVVEVDPMEEVAVTILVEDLVEEEEEIIIEAQETIVEEESNMVIQTEIPSKGIILGNYVSNGVRAYFSMSSKYNNPVVFGYPSLTGEITEKLQTRYPNLFSGVKKDLKKVSNFAKVNGNWAMVTLVDAKRGVFEGYIGEFAFTTTEEYLAEGYMPLVTHVSQFVENSGQHNSPKQNACTAALYKDIVSLINSYKMSFKYETAMLDTEYINAIRKQVQPAQTNSGAISVPVINYVCCDTIGGGDDYEPEF